MSNSCVRMAGMLVFLGFAVDTHGGHSQYQEP
jgi:hypothetical protein